jgi:hypothetical protein
MILTMFGELGVMAELSALRMSVDVSMRQDGET